MYARVCVHASLYHDEYPDVCPDVCISLYACLHLLVSISLCACQHVSKHMCTSVCMSVCASTCARLCTCVSVRISAHVPVRVHISVCMHARMHIHMCVSVCMPVCVPVHTHVHCCHARISEYTPHISEYTSMSTDTRVTLVALGAHCGTQTHTYGGSRFHLKTGGAGGCHSTVCTLVKHSTQIGSSDWSGNQLHPCLAAREVNEEDLMVAGGFTRSLKPPSSSDVCILHFLRVMVEGLYGMYEK